MTDQPVVKRQHIAWIVISAIRSLRSFALPLIILLFTGGRAGDGWYLTIAGGIAVVSLAGRALEWWRSFYELTPTGLRVQTGLFSRQDRFVPFDRIQTVDVAESPLQRLLGVVGVKIETAAGGSGAADVRFDAVTAAEANVLRGLTIAKSRTALTDGTPAVETSPSSELTDTGGTLLRRLSTPDLLIAGATSGRIGPALAVVSFGSQFLDDLLPDSFWERIAMTAPDWSFRGVLTLLAIGGIAAWIMAIVSTILTYGGFELRRDGDRLYLQYGLLDRRRSTIPLARIQAATMTEGLLRQPFGLASVRLASAGYGARTAESGVLFPILPRDEVPALLAAACPMLAAPVDHPALQSPPGRARSRYLLSGVWSFLILAALGLGIGLVTGWWTWRWGLVPLVAVPFTLVLGWLNFRDAGWSLDPNGQLVIRQRRIERITTVTLRRRLQHRSVHQNIFQRRRNLAHFGAVFAGSGGGTRVGVDHLDETVANDLMDWL